MQASATPSTVVAAETIALLNSQRANGCWEKRSVKLAAERWSGQGITARSRSSQLGSGGRWTMASCCWPEKAMLDTHSTG